MVSFWTEPSLIFWIFMKKALVERKWFNMNYFYKQEKPCMLLKTFQEKKFQSYLSRSSLFKSQNFLHRPTMVAEIFSNLASPPTVLVLPWYNNVTHRYTYLFKMNRMFFCYLKRFEFHFILLFSQDNPFQKIMLELLEFSLYANNLIQGNINVSILDYINGRVISMTMISTSA